ncbi:hypothetical protein FACS1894208_04970 [Clostridia bacterium]|nr:hypothetical protein FACS1894208_04970 [Clostridia bacterium]
MKLFSKGKTEKQDTNAVVPFGGLTLGGDASVGLVPTKNEVVYDDGALSFAVKVEPNTIYQITRNEIGKGNDKFTVCFFEEDITLNLNAEIIKTYDCKGKIATVIRAGSNISSVLIYLGGAYENLRVHIMKSDMFDTKNSYSLPPILRETDDPKTYEIVSCAFRKHDPVRGLSGGPNGVLQVQREVMGESHHDMPLTYVPQPTSTEYPEHLLTAMEDITEHMVKINFYAAYYIEYCIDVWTRRNKKHELFFVCHDVGTAYGAYLRSCRYVVVYHAQGSLAHERESFGTVFTEGDRRLLGRLEEAVLYNAEAVYFPSVGAKKSFIETTNIDCSKVKFGEPLYNTIPDMPPNLDFPKLLAKLNLPQIGREYSDVFLSVGDFSLNKGMERVPAFLEEYSKRTNKNVYWIAIGSKHKAGIFEQLTEIKDSWSFHATLIGTRTDHDTLLALMDFADYYIMFQRYSIFDFATLEAMRAGKGLILTPVGGNLEVNRDDNVVYVDLDNLQSAVSELFKKDKLDFGERNREAFNANFSKEQFYKSYSRMIDRHVLKG